MKNQVKKFSQYIKESDEFGMDSSRSNNFSNPDRISLMDLFECYAQTNFGMEKVLISADISNPASDLTHGGIAVTPNPDQDDIMEAIDFDLEWGLYDNGKLVDSHYEHR